MRVKQAMTEQPDKLAYWCTHYQSWQSSGLSQRAYCRQEGISFSTFDRWRSRVRSQSNSPKPPLLASSNQNLSPPPSLTLIPVQLATSSSADIQLLSPSGWRITIPAPTDPQKWLALLQQLS